MASLRRAASASPCGEYCGSSGWSTPSCFSGLCGDAQPLTSAIQSSELAGINVRMIVLPPRFEDSPERLLRSGEIFEPGRFVVAEVAAGDGDQALARLPGDAKFPPADLVAQRPRHFQRAVVFQRVGRPDPNVAVLVGVVD